MGARQLAGNGEAKPGAAQAGRAGEGLEEVVARLGRQARPVIGDGHRDLARGPLAGEAHAMGARLESVAAEVEHDAVELVAVAIDLETLWHRVLDARRVLAMDAGSRLDGERLGDVGDEAG